MRLRLGIDVSENNGIVDWDAVKAAGVEFAIVRSSYGRTGQDEYFRKNVHEAHLRGLECGAYHYSYALNVTNAEEEAHFCRQTIDRAGVLLELPVFFDMEDADRYKINRGFSFAADMITAMCRAFLENIALNSGVYASESWFNDYIDWKSLGCPVWNASWYSRENPVPQYGDGTDGIMGFMWQFTDKLLIGDKYFDGNVIYEAD